MAIAEHPPALPLVHVTVPRRQLTLRRLRQRAMRNMPILFALTLLLVIVLVAVFADVVSPHDPLQQDLAKRLQPPFWLAKGSLEYPLGTDSLGRDVLSRVIQGARVSLFLGFVASLGCTILGVTLGMIAGYVGGSIDDAIMRIAEAQLAFPFLVAAIAVIAVVGPSLLNLVLLLSVWNWATFAKVVRGEVLALKEKEFVLAARCIGVGAPRILAVHLLPNLMAPVLVLWTFLVASIILWEAGLSFIGFGVQPPTPSWGSMLADGRGVLDSAWWLATFPGVAIMLTVLAVNVLGDALRDVLDPRLRH